MSRNRTRYLLIAIALLGACSSAPRRFTPVLAAPPVDELQYRRDLEECEAQAVAGTGKGSARVASGTAGVAAGMAAGAVGSVATSGTYASYGAAMGAGAMALLAVPVAGITAAWGMARAKRHRRERNLEEGVTACLGDRGYVVTQWDRRRQQGTTASRRTRQPGP